MSEIKRLMEATNATIYERTRFGTGDIFPPLTAERAAWRAEVARLRGLVRGFTGKIAEHCDGEFSEEETAMVDIRIALGKQAEPDHSCARCGGSGWWWEDTPGGDYDTMLRECDHGPIKESSDED